MQNNSLEFIKKIPKTDLHVHLDGSIRLETLIEISKSNKLPLPSYTKEGLNKLVFKNSYQNLAEYLAGFNYIIPAMQTPEDLERISYEFAEDSIKDGVFYVETRFAPHLHINKHQNIDEVLLSINRGFEQARQKYNRNKTKEQPEFSYGIISCAMRSFTKGYSKFLDQVLIKNKNRSLDSIYASSSLDLVKNCIKIRDKYNLPIVAFDLAGEEESSPPIDHRKAYHYAHKHFMHSTVHAGESTGPECIFQAVTELYPERIGHGYYLFATDKITNPRIKNKARYLEKLLRYMTDRRITIEVCLTSNFQTISELTKIKNHTFRKMIAADLSTVICTDNRTVSKTSMTKELTLAVKNFNLDKKSLKDLVLRGFKRSFYPGTHKEKLNYIAKISNYYSKITK